MADVTFTPRPSFAYGVDSRRTTVRSPEESLVHFARQKNEREVTTWRLSWTIANRAEKFKLKKAWEDTDAGAVPFNYVRLENVSPSTVEALFVPDSLRIDMVNFERWNMSVEIEEVHD